MAKEKKPTYEQLILKLLEGEPTRYFFSYELVSRHIDGHWIGPSGDRIARYMAEDGKIERLGREEHNGKYAQYRAKNIVKPLTEDEKYELYK